MSDPFDPGNGSVDQEPLEDLLDPFEESLDPFRPGPGDPLGGLHEHDPASPVPRGPEIGHDFLDLVEASVLKDSGPSSQPMDLLDELEQSMESHPNGPMPEGDGLFSGEDGQTPNYGLPGPDGFQDGLFKEAPRQPNPGIDVRAPAPAMGKPSSRKEGFKVEHHPPVNAWRPRGSAGVRPNPAGPAKKEQEKDFKVCPRTNEPVARAECQSCQHFKGDSCAWRPKEEAEDMGGTD